MMTKQNVHRILPAMLALLLCLSLTACGKDSQSKESSTMSTNTDMRIADLLGGNSNGGSDNGTQDEDVVNEVVNETAGDISEYVGLWKYAAGDVWLMIYEGNTWEFLDAQEVTTAFGSLWVDETGITLCSNETGDVAMQLYRAESGELIDSESGDIFVPADSIQSSEPYFTSNGLQINAAVGRGSFLLKNGVCSYVNLGENYVNGDCYWEVVKNYDQIHDGIREIQFDAFCYIPQSSLGNFNQEFIFSCNSDLFDFYTGKWLTTASTTGTSNRGENYYVQTIDWNGQSETIEFAYSTEWKNNVGEWAHVLTKSYVVYLPEGYDGLIFAAEPEPNNYKDLLKENQLDSIMPDACIMDIDLLDPYGCLYFAVCY